MRKATDPQLAFDLRQPSTWGGARKNAGRKTSKTRRDPLHRERPNISRHEPQHVVQRTLPSVPRLRCGPIYRALHRAAIKMLAKPDFRVVHISIQRNHLHFIVEAENRRALRLGMQALAITAARAINAACGRTGKVFAYRYHATPIKTPKQARHCLSYVMNNWRRHDEDERSQAAQEALIDPYSSGYSFNGWREVARIHVPLGFVPLPVAQPTTWLLRVGWERHGPISVHEVPGGLATGTRSVRAR